MSPNADLLIIDDYNLPNIRWFNEMEVDTLYAYFNEFNIST